MINSRLRKLTSPALAGLFFSVLLLSCQSQKSPDEITLLFWQAVAANDPSGAEQYTSKDSQGLLRSGDQPFQGADFAIGQIVIDDNQARVETEARLADGSVTDFSTFLTKEDGQWQVDYRRTRYGLSANIFNGLFDSLKNIGENLNKQLEQQMPMLQQEVEAFGREMKKQLDQLGKELEKSLKSPEKQPAPEPDSI